MASGRLVSTVRRPLVCAVAAAGMAGAAASAAAADIGGWFAEQQKAKVQTGSDSDPGNCPLVIARAARDATALDAYQAAHCYLQADPPDWVAARAWLARSAELDFLPAHRLLRALQRAEAGTHLATRHCHDIGEGRQICHGGGVATSAEVVPK